MFHRVRWFKRLVRDLPQQLRLAYCLFRDPRVPLAAKAGVAAALGLILTPVIDIPEDVPLLGELDVVALTLLTLRLFIVISPPEVVAEQTNSSSSSAAASMRTSRPGAGWPRRYGAGCAPRRRTSPATGGGSTQAVTERKVAPTGRPRGAACTHEGLFPERGSGNRARRGGQGGRARPRSQLPVPQQGGGGRRRQDGGANPPARGGDAPPRREGAHRRQGAERPAAQADRHHLRQDG